MKRFNRIISTIVASALLVGCMVGCGSTNTAETTTEATEAKAAVETTEAQVEEVVESATKEDANESTGDDKIEIVTTIFPEYDWVKAVLGDNPANAEVTMLLDNGVDLHSYQPTADDIIKISTCDMFVYVGGESDEWVEDVLASAENKDMKVINLMDILSDLMMTRMKMSMRTQIMMKTNMKMQIMTKTNMKKRKLNMTNMYGFQSKMQ